ncbi:MAG: cation-translocating P-type ATPase [Deltaproteobacteria bacterium]|nr:cation-translocating P-type ATPase [Deltaproteobacteria bacterium]
MVAVASLKFPVDYERGRSPAEVTELLAEQGRNEIATAPPPSKLKLLIGQFKGAMVWLLIGATFLSAGLGEVKDAIAIGVILVLNALIGFIQEYRAEQAVQALRRMTAPRARVLRDGQTVEIEAALVVPGDVLVLDAGDVVAADARLIEAHRLKTNEAALTGESLPVEKRAGAEEQGASLAERHGEVFAGTAVSDGSARAIVTATGMRTELGKIAKMLGETADEETPLQKRLERVGRLLLLLCLGVVVLVAAVGFLRGMPWLEILMGSVSLAVAAVPEGLAAIVTIALAVGVQRMVAQKVLIRKLAAVETLGCATVICTDKTGTLTTGRMRVREVWGKDHARVLAVAASCSDAELAADEQDGSGDPTEVALLVAAALVGHRRPDIEATNARKATFPFDAERKRMSIFRANGVLYVKGAVELLLPLCASGGDGALQANAEMGAHGLRVLAVAVGKTQEERDLELVGLVGMADPPRTEAIDAVRAARQAGIRTVMITGDHPMTAAAIAKEMGILLPGDDPTEVVHARATPADKLTIVRAWKRQGDVVAMTGDGVNDAPALKEAHIGVAMGKGGTEVTREAADMVLVDDNFASIVAAVREGRGVYDNIRKALVYLLIGNVGELLLMLSASAAGLPLPLSPLQILWVNVITDGLPALALVMDRPDGDVLRRPPRRPAESILGRSQWTTIALTGLLEASVVFGVFLWMLETRDLATARNLAFSALVACELLRSFAARSTTKVFLQVGIFGNVTLLAVVVASLLVQLALHHVPILQHLFGLGALSATECALSFGVGLIPVTVIEVSKLLRRALGTSGAS